MKRRIRKPARRSRASARRRPARSSPRDDSLAADVRNELDRLEAAANDLRHALDKLPAAERRRARELSELINRWL